MRGRGAIHTDAPFCSTGNHLGWTTCRECVKRRDINPPDTSIRYYDSDVWWLVKVWRERIYAEMFEDYIRGKQ